MLKSKIDTAGLNNCNYAIETSDIEAINQVLNKKQKFVVKMFLKYNVVTLKQNF